MANGDAKLKLTMNWALHKLILTSGTQPETGGLIGGHDLIQRAVCLPVGRCRRPATVFLLSAQVVHRREQVATIPLVLPDCVASYS